MTTLKEHIFMLTNFFELGRAGHQLHYRMLNAIVYLLKREEERINKKDVEDVRDVLIKMRDEGRSCAYTECIDRLNGLLNKEEPKTYRYRVTGSDIVLPPNPPMICDCCWREMRGWMEVYDECKRAKLLLCTDCQDNAIFSGDMAP